LFSVVCLQLFDKFSPKKRPAGNSAGDYVKFTVWEDKFRNISLEKARAMGHYLVSLILT
jgi:hypothetical protein